MKLLILCLLLLSQFIPHQSVTQETEEVFAASTPCENNSKPVFNIPVSANCEFMRWQLKLYRTAGSGIPTTYKLNFVYGMTRPNTTGFGPGPISVERSGRWSISEPAAANTTRVIYRLAGSKPEENISFVRLADGLIHLLDREDRLMVGHSGWSYTLNKISGDQPRSRRPGETATVTAAQPADLGSAAGEARSAMQRYVGRSPCQALAAMLRKTVGPDCIKIKWDLRFNRDATSSASTYSVRHTLIRDIVAKTGKWRIVSVNAAVPGSVIYQLDPDKPEESLYLLRVDRNLLIFLDKDLNPLVGNADFSYTLNLIG